MWVRSTKVWPQLEGLRVSLPLCRDFYALTDHPPPSLAFSRGASPSCDATRVGRRAIDHAGELYPGEVTLVTELSVVEMGADRFGGQLRRLRPAILRSRSATHTSHTGSP